MPASIRAAFAWIASAVVLLPVPAQAQNPPKAEPGYELLVEAGELAKNSKALNAAQESGATLAQKRKALGDPPVARALNLMQQWLAQPTAPQAVLVFTDDTMLKSMSGARAVARALHVRQYVLLADGRVGEAIDLIRDGLRLSYAIQNHSLIGWLTGAAIDTIVVRPVILHESQWSARDSERLFRLAQEWANAADPLTFALERERRGGIASFAKTLSAAQQEGAQAASPSSEEMLKQMLGQAGAGISQLYGQAQKNLRTPYWQRPSLRLPETEGSPAGEASAKLVELLIPPVEQALDRYTRRLATARMLGCHAAVRRYQWENNKLPASLAELGIGEMAADPFSGKEFAYRSSGNTYRIESVGPMARDEAGNRQPNQRAPFTLLPTQ